MAFDGTEGGQISLETGAVMTAEYRRLNPRTTKAHFFGKGILNEILEQNGCMGIRMYYGIDENENKQLVIVGTDAEENDMTALVADLSFPCPDACGGKNELNS